MEKNALTKQLISEWYDRIHNATNGGESERAAAKQALRNLSDSLGGDGASDIAG
jgi:hypothetical protein